MSPGTMPGTVLDGQPRALEGKWLGQVTAVPLALLLSAWGQRLHWSWGTALPPSVLRWDGRGAVRPAGGAPPNLGLSSQ